jgi:hypothetical protein
MQTKTTAKSRGATPASIVGKQLDAHDSLTKTFRDNGIKGMWATIPLLLDTDDDTTNVVTAQAFTPESTTQWAVAVHEGGFISVPQKSCDDHNSQRAKTFAVLLATRESEPDGGYTPLVPTTPPKGGMLLRSNSGSSAPARSWSTTPQKSNKRVPKMAPAGSISECSQQRNLTVSTGLQFQTLLTTHAKACGLKPETERELSREKHTKCFRATT